MLFCQTLNKILFIIFFALLSCSLGYSKVIKYGYVKYNKLNLREAPSIESNILAKLDKNQKVKILNSKSGFFYVFIDSLNLNGYVYKKGIYNITTEILPDYKVELEMNSLKPNAQEKILEFKNLLNFDFYKKDVKIIFSYNPKTNIGRVFISTDFNFEYYNKHKDPSLKPNQIDFYPFLKFTNTYNNFLKKLSYKYKALSEFLQKFILNIMLKKNESNYIILECYRKNKLYLFKPYIFLKNENFKILKIYSNDKDLIKKSYIFTIGVPYLFDGSKTIDSLLYDFFNISY